MKNLKNLLDLLNNAINGGKTVNVPQGLDWEDIYKIAYQNDIAAIIFSTIAKLPLHLQPSPKQMAGWKDYTLQVGIQQLNQNMEMRAVLTGLKELSINAIIFKGPALAMLYPEPLTRVSADVDVLVREVDRDNLINYLNNNSYRLVEEQWNGHVLVYSSKKGLMIEFHFRLWEGYYGKKISILENMNIIDHTITIRDKWGSFDTFDYEGHLIYQIYHLVKHFSLEGIGLRYLADLTLFVNQYFDELDFAQFWKKMDLLGYMDFCSSLFTICVDNLGMNEKVLSCSVKVNKDQVSLLLEDIEKVGVSLENDNVSWNTMNIITPFLTGESDLPGNKFRSFIEILFPSKSRIINEYRYIKKIPILLPIAWIHRAFCHYLRNKKQAYTFLKIKKAHNRLELMKKMKLTNNIK